MGTGEGPLGIRGMVKSRSGPVLLLQGMAGFTIPLQLHQRMVRRTGLLVGTLVTAPTITGCDVQGGEICMTTIAGDPGMGPPQREGGGFVVETRRSHLPGIHSMALGTIRSQAGLVNIQVTTAALAVVHLKPMPFGSAGSGMTGDAGLDTVHPLQPKTGSRMLEVREIWVGPAGFVVAVRTIKTSDAARFILSQ